MAGEFPKVDLGPRTQKIGSGATPRGGKEVYLADGPFALIRSQNVHDFQFRFEGLAYIDQGQADELRNVEVLPNDILLNITGDSVARACIVDANALPARVNQHVSIIRADPNEFSQRFLLYALLDPKMKARLLAIAGAGATRNALTKSNLEDLAVPQPDRDEQDRIAHILETLDDKIALNRNLAATLEQMARTLFNSWFVNFDPVYAKAEGRDSGLPMEIAALFPNSLGDDGLPEGWRWQRADEIALSIRSAVDPKSIPSDTPYVGLEHLPRKSLGLFEYGEAREVDSNKLAFQKGDLLFGKLRPYFHKVSIAPVDGIASSDIFVFRAKGVDNASYMYLAFSDERFVGSASGASTGTRMPRAEWSHLAEQVFATDDGAVVEMFNEMARSYLDPISEKLAECRDLEQLRDTLLPKLLSGELRVEEAADKVAAA